MLDRSGYGPPHTGIRLQTKRTRSKHILSRPPTPPTCEEHGTELVKVRYLPDSVSLELASASELRACPRCFGSGDTIDAKKLAEEITANWSEYKQYFTNSNRPDSDRFRHNRRVG